MAMPETLRQQLGEYVAKRTGLHFPPARWSDLERGLTEAMHEFGFADLDSGAEWLLSSPETTSQLDVLASHLTIGETYFFREMRTFEVLAAHVLPKLVQARKSTRRLRIWSAACCTGEEPYSLAILLHQIIPNLSDWQLTILATDINHRFLKKGAAGIYSEWSFRDSPSWVKDGYFQRTREGRYALLPEIRNLVSFAHLNLVEERFPSIFGQPDAFDLIFCRNVLMYFSSAQARKVVASLRRPLVSDGWLVVSPSETSQTLFQKFATVNFPGVILYKKGPGVSSRKPSFKLTSSGPAVAVTPVVEPPLFELPAPVRVVEEAQPDPVVFATELYEQGDYARAVEVLLAAKARDVKTFSLLTRALADQGKLSESLVWSERWVNADKLDASAHYLRAVVLQELGEVESARGSLQTAIYIEPKFVLAHFALGNLARSRREHQTAQRHFANVLNLLQEIGPDETLFESNGLTAQSLSEIINSITAMEESK
jgi:chemotaxis protein methyltransferase CheR